jgi:hypothetical protein
LRQNGRFSGSIKVGADQVKRYTAIATVALATASCVFVYVHRGELGLTGSRSLASAAGQAIDEAAPALRTVRISWQPIDRPGDGFKVEMPEDPRQLQVPAYNEAGVSEPVNMVFSSPDGGTTYAVAWADNPPSMRLENHVPDATLDAARDGLLARTQTEVVSETRCEPQGFPGRDVLARNVGGGVMDARFIVAGRRLYLLTAAYPTIGARREQDVKHFFNSFAVTDTSSIAQASPRAAARGARP